MDSWDSRGFSPEDRTPRDLSQSFDRPAIDLISEMVVNRSAMHTTAYTAMNITPAAASSTKE